MTDNIDKALKRLEGATFLITWRGGKIIKIPKQDVELPLKDGVQIIHKIPSDITDNE